MYETVKRANGYVITRMKGTKGFYHVEVAKNKEVTFKTIKAAAEFCRTLPYKPVKCARAFGMVRTKLGYITKEELLFTLSDDSKKNDETIAEFAKKHGCVMVEVWYRNDNDWDKVIPYKIYNYHHTIDGDTLGRISIY
jgi:hypothetical protein